MEDNQGRGLVLTRKLGESIIINGNIKVTLLSTTGNQVKFLIKAPPEIIVDREEIHERRERDRVKNESSSSKDSS